MGKTIPLIKRFWERVLLDDDDKCWLWIGSTNGAHEHRLVYGKIWVNGRMYSASRMSWELSHGEIPKGMCVCHTCDNSMCVNPSHLFLGTNYDNVQDRQKKKRNARGDSNGRSKLSSTDVIMIRELCDSGLYKTKKIAKMYGISQENVYNIRDRKSWRCLE